MPIKAVIFDMDGVLIDSELYWMDARIDFAGAFGKAWTHDDQRAVMGRSTHEWAQIMEERLDIPHVPHQEIIDKVVDGVLARVEANLILLPGSIEAVHEAARGYRVGLASGASTPLIRKVTELTGLDKVFETMVFGDDIERGKPAPDIYLEAARRFGVSTPECVGIEDSRNGLLALQAAGMKAIAVPSPVYPLPEEILETADMVMPSLVGFSVKMIEGLDG